MMLVKVVSGGQTGVDIAALRAAKALGIPTGGWMPRGWRTLDGPRPEYSEMYGMREAYTSRYQDRTWANVSEAHATLRIASDWQSAGELCTMRAIGGQGRPHLDVTLHPDPSGEWYPPHLVTAIAGWIRGFGAPVVLNVAGNSERTSPGIERTAEALLRRAFAEAK